MAEAIAKSEAKKRNIDIEIASAGIYAFAGDSASLNAARVMEEMGLDVSCHIATPLSEEMLGKYDLILTMTNAHKASILNLYQSFKEKVFTLLEYTGSEGDIADPFGGDINIYRQCAMEIQRAIEKVFSKIMES